jgi:hypothetical protein
MSPVLELNMSMEKLWNDTDRRKPNYQEKNLSLCQKYIDSPGIKPGPPLPVRVFHMPKHDLVM